MAIDLLQFRLRSWLRVKRGKDRSSSIAIAHRNLGTLRLNSKAVCVTMTVLMFSCQIGSRPILRPIKPTAFASQGGNNDG